MGVPIKWYKIDIKNKVVIKLACLNTDEICEFL